MAECVAYVRRQCVPLFLQIDTYRLRAHSKGDDDRDPQEVQAYCDKDPLTLFMPGASHIIKAVVELV